MDYKKAINDFHQKVWTWASKGSKNKRTKCSKQMVVTTMMAMMYTGMNCIEQITQLTTVMIQEPVDGLLAMRSIFITNIAVNQMNIVDNVNSVGRMAKQYLPDVVDISLVPVEEVIKHIILSLSVRSRNQSSMCNLQLFSVKDREGGYTCICFLECSWVAER
eukprot:7051617-Ditylum_brightwellii.AAC.1